MNDCCGGRQPSSLLAPGELLIQLWEAEHRIAVCWGSWGSLSRNQLSYLIWFSSKQSVGGLAAFRAFLKSEYSEENIEFWVSCEDYKKTKSPAKLSPKARKIYDEFISVQATKEVCAQNISWANVLP